MRIGKPRDVERAVVIRDGIGGPCGIPCLQRGLPRALATDGHRLNGSCREGCGCSSEDGSQPVGATERLLHGNVPWQCCAFILNARSRRCIPLNACAGTLRLFEGVVACFALETTLAYM